MSPDSNYSGEVGNQIDAENSNEQETLGKESLIVSMRRFYIEKIKAELGLEIGIEDLKAIEDHVNGLSTEEIERLQGILIDSNITDEKIKQATLKLEKQIFSLYSNKSTLNLRRNDALREKEKNLRRRHWLRPFKRKKNLRRVDKSLEEINKLLGIDAPGNQGVNAKLEEALGFSDVENLTYIKLEAVVKARMTKLRDSTEYEKECLLADHELREAIFNSATKATVSRLRELLSEGDVEKAQELFERSQGSEHTIPWDFYGELDYEAKGKEVTARAEELRNTGNIDEAEKFLLEHASRVPENLNQIEIQKRIDETALNKIRQELKEQLQIMIENGGDSDRSELITLLTEVLSSEQIGQYKNIPGNIMNVLRTLLWKMGSEIHDPAKRVFLEVAMLDVEGLETTNLAFSRYHVDKEADPKGFELYQDSLKKMSINFLKANDPDVIKKYITENNDLSDFKPEDFISDEDMESIYKTAHSDYQDHFNRVNATTDQVYGEYKVYFFDDPDIAEIKDEIFYKDLEKIITSDAIFLADESGRRKMIEAAILNAWENNGGIEQISIILTNYFVKNILNAIEYRYNSENVGKPFTDIERPARYESLKGFRVGHIVASGDGTEYGTIEAINPADPNQVQVRSYEDQKRVEQITIDKESFDYEEPIYSVNALNKRKKELLANIDVVGKARPVDQEKLDALYERLELIHSSLQLIEEQEERITDRNDNFDNINDLIEYLKTVQGVSYLKYAKKGDQNSKNEVFESSVSIINKMEQALSDRTAHETALSIPIKYGLRQKFFELAVEAVMNETDLSDLEFTPGHEVIFSYKNDVGEEVIRSFPIVRIEGDDCVFKPFGKIVKVNRAEVISLNSGREIVFSVRFLEDRKQQLEKLKKGKSEIALARIKDELLDIEIKLEQSKKIVEKITRRIENQRSWKRLGEYMAILPGIEYGKDKYLAGDEIIDLINKFRRGEVDLNEVPEEYGLRSKVAELAEEKSFDDLLLMIGSGVEIEYMESLPGQPDTQENIEADLKAFASDPTSDDLQISYNIQGVKYDKEIKWSDVEKVLSAPHFQDEIERLQGLIDRENAKADDADEEQINQWQKEIIDNERLIELHEDYNRRTEQKVGQLNSWDELTAFVTSVKGVVEPDENFTDRQTLLGLIDEVKSGQQPVTVLPEVHGLRDKVNELKEREILRPFGPGQLVYVVVDNNRVLGCVVGKRENGKLIIDVNGTVREYTQAQLLRLRENILLGDDNIEPAYSQRYLNAELRDLRQPRNDEERNRKEKFQETKNKIELQKTRLEDEIAECNTYDDLISVMNKLQGIYIPRRDQVGTLILRNEIIELVGAPSHKGEEQIIRRIPTNYGLQDRVRELLPDEPPVPADNPPAPANNPPEPAPQNNPPANNPPQPAPANQPPTLEAQAGVQESFDDVFQIDRESLDDDDKEQYDDLLTKLKNEPGEAQEVIEKLDKLVEVSEQFDIDVTVTDLNGIVPEENDTNLDENMVILFDIYSEDINEKLVSLFDDVKTARSEASSTIVSAAEISSDRNQTALRNIDVSIAKLEERLAVLNNLKTAQERKDYFDNENNIEVIKLNLEGLGALGVFDGEVKRTFKALQEKLEAISTSLNSLVEIGAGSLELE